MIGAVASAGAQLHLFELTVGRQVTGSGKSTITSYGYSKGVIGGINPATRTYGSTGKSHEITYVTNTFSQILIGIVAASDGTNITNSDATFKTCIVSWLNNSTNVWSRFYLYRTNMNFASMSGVDGDQFSHVLGIQPFSDSYTNGTKLFIEFRAD